MDQLPVGYSHGSNFDATAEAKIWNNLPNAMDPVYTIYVNSCLRYRILKKPDELRKVLSTIGSSLPLPQNDSELLAINCKDYVERSFTPHFVREYRELFLCKNDCQRKSPHGVSANISRGVCYKKCQTTFNDVMNPRTKHFLNSFKTDFDMPKTAVELLLETPQPLGNEGTSNIEHK